MNWIQKLGKRSRRHRVWHRRRNEFPVTLESLEPRILMSVTTVFNKGILRVKADAADNVAVTVNAGNVQVNNNDPADGPVAVADVTRIDIKAKKNFPNTIDLSGIDANFTNLTRTNVDAGDGNDLLIGSDLQGPNGKKTHGDRLFGGDGNNTIRGGAGDDTLVGGRDNDSFMGEDGDDYMRAPRGDNTFVGGIGDDSAFGGTGNDLFFGDAGVDLLVGGRKGVNVINGGDDDDSLIGGRFNDTIFGDDGNDLVLAEAGEDAVDGGLGDDSIDGDRGNDTIIGGDGTDSLDGGQDNDVVDGQAGNGDGDRMIGGPGSDRFFTDDVDTVLDFKNGVDTLN